MSLPLVSSPLNYTGGKFKLLPQILPLFPKKIDTFVDLFCGGCNVGLNVKAKKTIYNDNNRKLYDLYTFLSKIDSDKALKEIYKIITNYGLTLVSRYGYSYYNCDSKKGLGDYNKEGFLQLRRDFNANKKAQKKWLMLYVMIVYAFNNQIRFNSKGEYNLPVGKRDFNAKMRDKIVNFINRIKEQNSEFVCMDFRNFNINNLKSNDFVYIDPPYLITCATYNENGGWTDEDEKSLLKFIDNLNNKGIKFALSNVLSSKGKNNEILKQWLENRQYFTHHLNYHYTNSNYQTKNKTALSDEVLITNYKD